MDAAVLILDNYQPTAPPPVPAHGEKGLQNYIGENNCFLNVNIQALWHLRVWREQLMAYEKDHSHTDAETCVFCSLKAIMTEYRYGEDAFLPPTSLRKALAVLYKDLERFQLGKIDDASEALESLLACIHENFTGRKGDDKQMCEPQCLAHRVFGLDVIEQIRCVECHATSEMVPSTLFIAYTYAAALREVAKKQSGLSFCEFLRRATDDDTRMCPNREKCKATCSVFRFLKRAPRVLVVGMVWDTPNPPKEDVAIALDIISLRIDIGNIFHMSGAKHTYKFRGMICYYGLHYSAFFWNSERSQWFIFDDANVKEVGAQWSDIRDRCIRGRMQPSVLFYEREPDDVAVGLEEDYLLQTLSSTTLGDSKLKSAAPSSPVVSTSPDQPLLVNPPLKAGDLLGSVPNQAGAPTVNLMTPDSGAMPVPPVRLSIPPSAAVTPAAGGELNKSNPHTTEQSPARRMEESFVMLQPHPEIEVMRSVWLYRRQARVLRFMEDKFMRVDSTDSNVVKESWDYKEVAEIFVRDNTNIVVRFRNGHEDYLSSPRALEVVELLRSRAPLGSVTVHQK